MDARRICIIDDDEAVRDSLRTLLECEGFHVSGFSSSQDFLERDGGADAACLVIDVEMPKVNGLTLVSMLRRDGRTVPVVLISGAFNPKIAARARELGAEFLEKPFADEALVAALRRATA